MSARLSELTTFRLGGPCRTFTDCATPVELRQAIGECAQDFLLIGGGSNLLVSDEGLPVDVIRYSSLQPRVARDECNLDVDASTALDDLAAFSVSEGLAGLVCCTGIPGTVGGAIAGNAGAFGEQIGDRVISVTLMDRAGNTRSVPASDLGFAYRRSALQRGTDIVVSARIGLSKGDRSELTARREEIIALRASKHPDWRKIPTAGSFFKNIEPTSKAERRQAAGWFLEQAGAMEMRVGGARTYERHANIIVGDPGCTAADVWRLSHLMAAAVRGKFGFELEREVRVLGAFHE